MKPTNQREKNDQAIRLMFVIPLAIVGGPLIAGLLGRSGMLVFVLGGAVGGAIGGLLGEGVVRLLRSVWRQDENE